jgi:hypothetical protein
VALLAARAPKLRQALDQARQAGHAYVVIDGTLAKAIHVLQAARCKDEDGPVRPSQARGPRPPGRTAP